MAQTGEICFIFLNNDKDVKIVVKGFETNDWVIIATVNVTNIEGDVLKDVYQPFKVGHKYRFSDNSVDTDFNEFLSFAYEYGLNCDWYVQEYTESVRQSVPISFSVYGDDRDSTPIEGAEVIFNESAKLTDEEGFVKFLNSKEGSICPFVVIATNFDDYLGDTGPELTEEVIEVEMKALRTVEFDVLDSAEPPAPVAGAKVTFNDEEKLTDDEGKAIFTGVHNAPEQTYTVEALNYVTFSDVIDIVGDDVIGVNLTLD